MNELRAMREMQMNIQKQLEMLSNNIRDHAAYSTLSRDHQADFTAVQTQIESDIGIGQNRTRNTHLPVCSQSMETLPSAQLSDPFSQGEGSEVVKQLMTCIQDLQT